MTEDLNDLVCPHSAAGRPERFPAKACILAGECGCVYGAEYDRYGHGAHWSVGVFSDDSRQTFGETIDAAMQEQKT